MTWRQGFIFFIRKPHLCSQKFCQATAKLPVYMQNRCIERDRKHSSSNKLKEVFVKERRNRQTGNNIKMMPSAEVKAELAFLQFKPPIKIQVVFMIQSIIILRIKEKPLKKNLPFSSQIPRGLPNAFLEFSLI